MPSSATDGDIGHVKDFYFDDEAWVVRYLIVETGNWLSSRKVLISPIAIGRSNWADKVLSVSITRDKVKNSPDIDTDKPVSRQHEMKYLGYYDYSLCLGRCRILGCRRLSRHDANGRWPHWFGAEHLAAQADQARVAREADQHENDDPHLRSGIG